MAQSRNVNLFLIDGESDGRIKCTISNWNGVAYKIPRIELNNCKDRKDMKHCGIYILLGDKENEDRPVAYIGQAGRRKNGEGIMKRLEEHDKNPDMDFWSKVLVFTTTDDTMGPTELCYLENKFCNDAIAARRFAVENGNDPTPGNVTEEQESDLQEFAQRVKLITSVFGVPLFDAVYSPTGTQADAEPMLFYNRSGVQASGKRTRDGFVVLAGSHICANIFKGCPNGTRKLREGYKSQISADGTIQEDLSFTSASGAASFIGGCAINGLKEWKDAAGESLGDLMKKQQSGSTT